TETEKVCKPSESEGGQPSEPVEPTPGDDGVVTVTTTVVDPNDPNCPSGGGDEPTPAPSEDPDPTPTNPDKSSKSSLGWLLVPLIPLLSSGKSSAVPSGKPVPHSSVPSTDEKRLEEKPQKEADNVLEDTHQDGETNPHGPTEKAPLVAKPTSTQGTPTAHTERFTGLANTGASVLGLVLCGLAALAAGLFLVRRNRKSTES
ncbi:LPXTG cell wall anchor domain-containing protein, partial [Corynebacterium tuberculostearicum]|uniref:LPXTG cell wall anchor domain-containing protein n=1 Tax=Corynebacterium tuberculostearicum TaxID=38304 RepID=UPI002026DF5D